MKKIFLFLLCIFVFFSTIIAQNICGVYFSENGKEFICIKNDTILFRLYNYDAFGSYSVFYGACDIDSKKIMLKNNILIERTSKLTIAKYEDQRCIKLELLYNDNTPMIYTHVFISDITNNKNIIHKTSDSFGCVYFSEKELNPFLSSVVIEVENLDFHTRQKINLGLGNIYIIKSIVPIDIPFIMFSCKKLKYSVKKGEIELIYSKRQKIRLQKDQNNKCCFGLFIHEN